MLTLFFLDHYKTPLCRIEELRRSRQCQIVLIVGEIESKTLSDAHRQRFDAVHLVRYRDTVEDAVRGKDLNGLCPIAVESVVNQYRALPNFQGVCLTFNEIHIFTMEEINRSLGWQDDTPHSVFRDKTLSKHALQRAGLRCPTFESFDQDLARLAPEQYCRDLLSRLGRPFILKPTALASSVGVKKIYDEADFNYALTALIGGVNYEVESFINGEVYHCDMLMMQDNCLFVAVSKYINTPLEGAAGEFFGSVVLSPDYPHWQKIAHFAKLCLKALGMKTGVAHMELFIDQNGEPVFLECASRTPGSLICETYLKHFGISLPDMHMRMLMGLPVDVVNTSTIFGASLWAYIPTYQDGIFREINMPPTEDGQEITLSCNFKEGDPVKAGANFMFPIGHIMMYDDNVSRLLTHTIPRLKSHNFIVS